MSNDLAAPNSVEHFSVWGTSATLAVTGTQHLAEARAILDDVLSATTTAASRFDSDSEISRLNAKGSVAASPWFLSLLHQALRAFELSDGLCDPTIAPSLISLGYDQDFDALTASDEAIPATNPAPGWSAITIGDDGTVTLAEGAGIDLGATAKAAAADAAATTIATQLGCGVLVDLGGDLRIAGPAPQGGWAIGMAKSAKSAVAERDIDEVVALAAGAMTSSSSIVRTWQRDGTTLHHIIDPRTGRSAQTPWAMASVVAANAVDANALSTAAIIWGEDAIFELAQRSTQARLLRHDGSIERVGGWVEPTEGKP